jgi:uncharacterized alpha-E superfamily protein
MLSRVAESVHWMSRYVERAENLTRVLAVHALNYLDAPHVDTERGFRALVAFLGREEDFAASFDRYDARTVSEYFVSHPGNPSAVLSSIARARENARAVREQITSEMWEHLNRLYFAVKDVQADEFARGPYAFYRRVRDGSQAFQGITHATMIHNEPYWFIQLGKHLERAGQTLRVLEMRYAALRELPDGASATTLELIAVLKACSAFEPFRQTPGTRLTTASVAEFLLGHRRFPRAVACCLRSCADALERISELAGGGAKPSRHRQLLGRLCANLEYLEIDDVLGPAMQPFLEDLLGRVYQVGDEVAKAYFSTRIVLPRGRGPYVGPPEQQQQQQQQQGDSSSDLERLS